MHKFIYMLLFFSLSVTALSNITVNKALAQQVYSPEPLCLTITNEEDRRVYGHLETAYDLEVEKRHRAEFRLEPGESTQACSTGPFYGGNRLKLQIKTLLPLFECKTLANQDITIKRKQRRDGEYRKNDQGYIIWAECY